MYERTYGAKYDDKLSTKDIAARVRAEIRAAVKAGTLPAGTYSVRKDHYRSIVVNISDLGADVFDPEYLAGGSDYLMGPSRIEGGKLVRPSRYTPRINAAVEAVEGMLAAYNHDGSDIQTDYFDVNFYSHVNVRADEPEARAVAFAPAVVPAEPAQVEFMRSMGAL